MKNNDIERRLKQAVEQITPDVLDNILSQCNQQSGKVMKMKKFGNRKLLNSIVGIAAAFAIIVGGFFAVRNLNNDSVYSTVTLDVNPSIELSVTDKEKIIEVKPLNNDAKTVIGDMNFKDSSIDVAVNAIIGSMLRNGYIDELSNSILVSVDCLKEQDGKKLEEKLNKNIEELLKNDSFSGAVLSQTVNHKDDIDSKAEKYGITVGKAQLINKIIASNNRYSFEQLVPLTINELNLIAKPENKPLESVNIKGNSSDKKYIGHDKAKKIALSHSGASENKITDYDCELEYENGKMIYEVDFNLGYIEYEYDIDAVSGEIIKSYKENDKDENDDKPISSSSNPKISKAKAKEIALNHASKKSSEISQYEIELDRDDGRLEYEISFNVGKTEYDYTINAETGKIIKSEKDYDDDSDDEKITQKPSSQTSVKIDKAKAKSIALNHAGVKASEIREYEIELDKENGKYEYEVSFKSGKYEYDYSINAQSGKIIKNEKEKDD